MQNLKTKTMAVQIKAVLPRCAKLLVISCTMLLFLQQIRGQSNYVDFLKKSNDALALKILSALAGISEFIFKF